MKRFFIFGVAILYSCLIVSCQEQDVTEFRDSEQKIVSKFFDEGVQKEIFLTTTPNSSMYAISVYKGEELVPIVYYTEKENGDYTLLGIDGVEIEKGRVDVTIKDVEEKKEERADDVFVKVVFTKSSDCIGGSTKGCYKYAREACKGDKGCNALCEVAGWRCRAAIAAACFIHCNT